VRWHWLIVSVIKHLDREGIQRRQPQAPRFGEGVLKGVGEPIVDQPASLVHLRFQPDRLLRSVLMLLEVLAFVVLADGELLADDPCGA
jgi:hypothetical protein